MTGRWSLGAGERSWDRTARQVRSMSSQPCGDPCSGEGEGGAGAQGVGSRDPSLPTLADGAVCLFRYLMCPQSSRNRSPGSCKSSPGTVFGRIGFIWGRCVSIGAFTAVLCRGVSWLHPGTPETKEGALVAPWFWGLHSWEPEPLPGSRNLSFWPQVGGAVARAWGGSGTPGDRSTETIAAQKLPLKQYLVHGAGGRGSRVAERCCRQVRDGSRW